jgi:DNA/RNA endonuclease YhcR with UshA esterase domain
MKTRNNFFTGLLFIVIAISSCVKGDFDAPPINFTIVNFEANTTIAELKMSHEIGTSMSMIEDNIIIKGIVIANDESGNLYKKIIMQDETGGIDLPIDQASLYNEYKVGQRLFVKAKGMYIGDYNGLIQLGYINDTVVGRLPEILVENHIFPDSLPGPKPEPQTINLDQLNSSLVSTLVKIDNISFRNPGELWAPQGPNATNRGINEAEVSQFVVRTSSYANFASERVPSDNGSITGVLSIFRDTYQLTLRDLEDVGEFSDNGGGGGGEPGELNPIDEVDENFDGASDFTDIAFTGWSNIIEAGTRRWQGKEYSGNKYAQATGYNSGLSSMVTWLITPPVKMDETKYLNFVSAKAYWKHSDNSGLTVWASTDYDGANVAAASWTQLDVRVAEQSDADNAWIESGAVDLSNFMNGEYVFIAFKYKGSNTESTSFRIDDVYIGTDENGGGGGGGGGGGTGGGSFDEPFTIAQAIENQNATPYVTGWIEGYIVGTVKDVSSVSSNDDIQLSGPFDRVTNVLLADDPNETNYTNMVAVNLKAGSVARAQINLADNPDNLRKMLNVTGVLHTYFGMAGSRDSEGTAADFDLEGGGGGGGGGGGDAVFFEDFDSTLGAFTAFDNTGPKSWEWASFDGGCAYINGFDSGSNTVNEDWLVSPAIDLSSHTDSKLAIRHAANYLNGNWDLLQVLMSTDYNGTANPADQGSWVEITIPNLPPGNSWVFFDSGDIDISEYDGQSSVFIALRYRSNSNTAAAWEVSRIEVK